MTKENALPLARQIVANATDKSIKSAVARHVHYVRGVLQVCDDLYHLNSFSRVLVIAFGQAAHIMSEALAEQLGSLAAGIICAPERAGQSQLPGFRYFHGGTPLPNRESIRAADAILKSLTMLAPNSLVIYLISAGSSFVESPVDQEISLDDLIETYKVLGDSASKPDEAKAILKHLSAVKGGHMALAAGTKGAQQVSIFVCHTSNDLPPELACGPTLPDRTTVEDCYRIAEHYRLTEKFPAGVRELFDRRALDETPDEHHPAFHNCRWWPVFPSKEQK